MPPARTQLPAVQEAYLQAIYTSSDGKPKAGPRKPLSVALSKDNGATWSAVRDLELGLAAPQSGKGPNRKEPGREEYSCPTLTQVVYGKVNVACTYRRYNTKAVRFDEKWIESGTTTGVYKPHP